MDGGLSLSFNGTPPADVAPAAAAAAAPMEVQQTRLQPPPSVKVDRKLPTPAKQPPPPPPSVNGSRKRPAPPPSVSASNKRKTPSQTKASTDKKQQKKQKKSKMQDRNGQDSDDDDDDDEEDDDANDGKKKAATKHHKRRKVDKHPGSPKMAATTVPVSKQLPLDEMSTTPPVLEQMVMKTIYQWLVHAINQVRNRCLQLTKSNRQVVGLERVPQCVEPCSILPPGLDVPESKPQPGLCTHSRCCLAASSAETKIEPSVQLFVQTASQAVQCLFDVHEALQSGDAKQITTRIQNFETCAEFAPPGLDTVLQNFATQLQNFNLTMNNNTDDFTQQQTR